MIKINGQCIANRDEFAEFFNIDEMSVPAVLKKISVDDDIFMDDELYLRDALETVLSSDADSFDVDFSGAHPAVVPVGGTRVEIVYTPAEALQPSIRRFDLLRLLLCEIGRCPLPAEEPGELKGGRRTYLHQTGTVSGSEGERHLESVAFTNRNSDSADDAMLVLGCDGRTVTNYCVSPGQTVSLLRLGKSYVGKLPQMSVSRSHVNYMIPLSDGKVRVAGRMFNSGSKCVEQEFDAESLTQVCADEAAGFVALCGGRVVSYSREIQPDDIDDLMMDLPAGEKVVMIALAQRNLVVLTDCMNVYSSCGKAEGPSDNVVWLRKRSDGKVEAVGADDARSVENVDFFESENLKINYNNGQIQIEYL